MSSIGPWPRNPGQKVVTFDLDSTLSDTSARHHLIPENTAGHDWTEYGLACGSDVPFKAACRLANIVAMSCDIAIVSGRARESEDLTLKWLEQQDIYPKFMLLDDVGWTETHAAYKVRRLRELLDRGWDVMLHIDDQKDVRVAVEKELDIPTLIVTPDYANGTQALL